MDCEVSILEITFVELNIFVSEITQSVYGKLVLSPVFRYVVFGLVT